MTNFVDPRKATQIKYEPSSSTFRHALLLITMQKGRLCCDIVNNNFIAVQMQHKYKSWTDNFFKRKCVSLCSMNSMLLTNQQKRWCYTNVTVKFWNKTMCLSYRIIIHFVILRNFYNKKETVSIKYLNNLYFVNLNALSNHSSANTNASCCLREKKSRAEIYTEEKILKKIQKLEANQR